MIPSERPDHPDASPSREPYVEKSALRLPESKACLVEFLVADLRQSIARAEEALTHLESPHDRADAGRVLAEIGEATARTARFFEFEHMAALGEALTRLGAQAGRLSANDMAQALPRAGAVVELLREQADALAWGSMIRRPVEGLCASIRTLLDGSVLSPDRTLAPGASANDALEVDCVVMSEASRPAAPTIELPALPAHVKVPRAEIPVAHAPELDELPEAAPIAPTVFPPVFAFDPAAASLSTAIHLADTAADHTPIALRVQTEIAAPVQAAPNPEPAPEPTPKPESAPSLDAVSVPADRLDALLGLVGDLAMQNDRLNAITGIVAHPAASGGAERLTSITGSVARVAAELRDAVLDTRLVTLHHLFARLRMVAAERAQARAKRIDFRTAGAEPRIDCALASRLADPLAALIHAIVDFGAETPRERAAAGKPDAATVTLGAEIHDGTLKLELSDDGRGLSRRRVARKALRLGLIGEPALESMTDDDVFALVFTPAYGADDAAGLHEAHRDIAALGGSISLSAIDGRGATLTVRTPIEALTTPALLVEVGNDAFALPVADIEQIVRPAPDSIISSPAGASLRCDGRVLPIVDAATLLGLTSCASSNDRATFIVLSHATDAIALRVTRALGTRDIIVRPLDAATLGSAPIRGGTICAQADGDAVTLVIDTRKALARASASARAEFRTAA